jgi:hypothetical protein
MEPQRDQSAQNATKAQRLWPCGGVGGDGYPGDSCLRDALEELRPWRDEWAVGAALQTWADRHYPRPMKGDVADVAADLKIIGTATELPDAESAAGMTAFMMVNVFHGRETHDYDMLREVVKGIPASTARRYRHDHSTDETALFEYMRRIQYEQDLVALMRAGRKLPAARRYLERHPRTPSMGAYPAPLARHRYSGRPIDHDEVRAESTVMPSTTDGENPPTSLKG